MILKVVDAGCGVGKTTSMINFINENGENEKFLYLAISQLISMVMLSLLWIILGYVLVWAFST